MTTRLALSETHRRVLQENPWLSLLDQAVSDDVLAHSRLRKLTGGQALFRRGENPDGLYIVLDGSLRISGTTREGQEAVLVFCEPGRWIGLVSGLDGGARMHDVLATSPSVVLQIAPADLEQLIAQHPSFGRLLLRVQCSQMRELLMGIETYSTHSLEQRFAGRLLALAAAFGDPAPDGALDIQLRLSQETLAQLLGTTRQRVNQLLKLWEQNGLIRQKYGRIRLLDQAQLKVLAQV
ncbi:Crp/Fnr family transcriptional regulator [Aquipseudomonas alcaligenes]|uniref:Crp/Fnr family transcriptional regulator n=1 Tax=Aquipseudomonas alcaligenes TaxID=43263 RepID=UPI0016598952|nr:Crp/Fnr family transcriptional regulator [Pseudomonas alcaligenes]